MEKSQARPPLDLEQRVRINRARADATEVAVSLLFDELRERNADKALQLIERLRASGSMPLDPATAVAIEQLAAAWDEHCRKPPSPAG